MALSLTGSIDVRVQLTQKNALDLTVPVDSLSLSGTRSLTSGTGADQVDLMWHDQRTLTNGATEALALHDASLSGAFGTITLDKLKGICIQNLSTENSIKIGGAGATAVPLFDNTSDILVLPPASATNKPSTFLMEAPAAAGLATGTNEVLKIAHSGTTTNSIIYNIIVWGED